MNMWEPVELEYDKIEKTNILHDIAYGKYPALLVKDFYEEHSCRRIANKITNISTFDYGTGIVKKVGIFLLPYVSKKHDYFDDAKDAEESFETLFENVTDPRRRVHELIGRLLPAKKVSVAEDDGRKYSAGIIRVHEAGDSAPLHRDNATFDANGFNVACFQHQLSGVLYIQQSESGGELVIYNRLWVPSDERFREVGFGYSKQVINDNAESIIIRADVGDLVIINPKYFHEVLPVTGKRARITFGMFIAFNDREPDVVTWS
jgi:hypothetical protein